MLHARADYQGIQDWPTNRPHIETTIGRDEPVILFRAQDRLISRVILYYMNLLEHKNPGNSEDVLDALEGHLTRIKAWQEDHPTKYADLKKVPISEPINLTDEQVDVIASIVHQANKQYQVANYKSSGIDITRDWLDIPSGMKASVRIGVLGIVAGNTPEQSHDLWCKTRRFQGWTYGAVKDESAKTHPCLVPYDQLPQTQKFKDSLFSAIVHTCMDAIHKNPAWPNEPEGEIMGNEYTDQGHEGDATFPVVNPADGGITEEEVLDNDDYEDEGEDDED